eukprot:2986278-Pleurochrysis_carterae.AAC.3
MPICRNVQSEETRILTIVNSKPYLRRNIWDESGIPAAPIHIFRNVVFNQYISNMRGDVNPDHRDAKKAQDFGAALNRWGLATWHVAAPKP